MSNEIKQTKQTQLKRLPKRGHFDRETINAILDEAFICHVGFVVDGQPYVIPTGFARVGDDLYIHGSSASRMLRSTLFRASGCRITRRRRGDFVAIGLRRNDELLLRPPG